MDWKLPLRAVRAISRSQWKDGYGRGTPILPETTPLGPNPQNCDMHGAISNVPLTSIPAVQCGLRSGHSPRDDRLTPLKARQLTFSRC